MFKAILFICSSLLGNTECLEIEDTRGPYDTRGECIKRAVEMYHSTQLLVPPPYKSVRYECESGI